MRKLILSAAFCSLLLPALSFAQGEEVSEDAWDARITALKGEVFVYVQTGEGEEAEGVAAQKGMPINAGDRVETRATGSVEIALDSDSIIDLGPNSIFIVESDSNDEWAFMLELGEMISKLRSVLSTGRRLSFKTPTAVAAVRGTEIWAHVADEGDSTFGVVDEGKVSVRVLDDDSIEPVILKSRQQVVIGVGKRFKFATKGGRRMLRARKFKPKKRMMRRLKNVRARRAVLRRSWKRMARGERRQMRQNIRQRHRQKMRRMPRKQRQRLRQRLKQRVPTHMKRRMQRRQGRQGRRGKGRQKRRGGKPGRRGGNRRRGGPRPGGGRRQ